MRALNLSMRQMVHIVKANGYWLKRTSGDHFIYCNACGEIIVISMNPNIIVFRRMIKEHNLVIPKKY